MPNVDLEPYPKAHGHEVYGTLQSHYVTKVRKNEIEGSTTIFTLSAFNISYLSLSY